MLELNIYQNQNQNAGNFGKWYARVEGKEQMSVYDMAVQIKKASRNLLTIISYTWALTGFKLWMAFIPWPVGITA